MRKWLIGALATLALSSGLMAGAAFGRPQTGQKWLTIPWLSNLGTAPLVVGSASGRGWIGFDRGDGRLALASLRAVAGGVSLTKGPSLATNGAAAQIVESGLLFHPPELGAELRRVPLLENGMLGTPSELPGNPERVPPQNLQPMIMAGIQVGDRAIWVLGGGSGYGKGHMWACCSSAGGLSDLTGFLDQKRGHLFAQLGLDAVGRLWLAWLDHGRAVLGVVRMLELDPATLAPRASATLSVPGSATSTGFKLICAAACRVVMSRASGDIVSWSPNERSPTRLASGTRTNPANLLAASYRSGDVTVAYSRSRSISPLKSPVIAIAVLRGDSRGAHSRRLGSVDIPSVINPLDPNHVVMHLGNYGTFTTDGVVFFATYEGEGTRVVAGLIRVGR